MRCVVIASVLVLGIPAVHAAPASTAFAIVDEIRATPPTVDSAATLAEELVRSRADELGAAVLACFEPTAHLTATLDLTVERDGTVVVADAAIPQQAACVKRRLATIHFSAFEVPRLTAVVTMKLDRGPHGCDRVWRLGDAARLCARSAVVERWDTSGLVEHFPRTRVLDATPDLVVMAGSCGSGDLPDTERTALCVIGERGASIVYGLPADARDGDRGAVLIDDGILVMTGRRIGVSSPTNKNTGPWSVDIERQLVADGIKHEGDCRWTIRERLHRAASNGAFRATFETCRHEPVAVEVTVDMRIEAFDHPYHFERLPQ